MPGQANTGLSKAALAVIVVVVVIVVAVGAYFAVTYHPVSKKPTAPPPVINVTKPTVTVVSNQTITLAPSNPNELVDISQTTSPDCLDPATGFYGQDTPIFNVVYQTLVIWDPNNIYGVEPALASNWTVSPDYKHYIFTLRQGVYFTDGEQFNATVVWFSFYRTIIIGQGPGVSNYMFLLFNETIYENYGYAIPWGVCDAMTYATGNAAYASNVTLCAYALANLLSNFDVHNSTIQKIMSYPNQAIVVLGPYKVEFNLLRPYMYFLLDIASWWGAVVPPAYVDAHGGVEPNQPNSYLCQYGLPGTGPYVIKSVTGTPGEFTEIILQINPNYWGNNYPPGSLPILDQPGHIQIIDLKISESHTNRVVLFGQNKAQITYVDPPFLSQLYSAWSPYNKYLPPQSIIHPYPELTPACIMMLSMNTQRWPTNITDFRLAIEHAINYTALLYTYYSPLINMTLAKLYLGPFTPLNPVLYNPGNLPFYSYNTDLAIQYLNKSGWEGNFYAVLPNGKVIGNPNGQKIPTLSIYVIPPVTPMVEAQLEIVAHDLEQIGIPTAISYVTSAEFDSWTSPSVTGHLIYGVGWCADWPDPIMQIAMSILMGSLPTGDYAWYNNPTVNNLLLKAAFTSNQTLQIQLSRQIYSIVYNDAPYVWIPDPMPFFIYQPYLKGFVVTWTGYYYNTMYYKPVTISIITYSNGTKVTQIS
ncbi:MAG: ABC transporter substrate-binding protein [Vulcanisaeta sp.]|uniref:ABC transporter substrate-binding protein n=1 Tax=Vulcanisaeta sp. TaxID=2020871 RepID=UPI003D0D2A6D